MTRRAARRRRLRLAIVAVVVGALGVAWWFRAGGGLPALDPQPTTASPAPVTTGAGTPLPAPPAPPASVGAPVQAQIAALDAAQARDEEWAAARRESIRVQQRLRAEAAEQRARAEALETGDDIRCVDGHRMRRVPNGWVDAGAC